VRVCVHVCMLTSYKCIRARMLVYRLAWYAGPQSIDTIMDITDHCTRQECRSV